METKILGLRTTVYRVADIQAATEWYTKVFEVQPYFVEPFYVGFDIGGYELGLQPQIESGNDKVPNVVAYWGVEDIDAVFSRFVELGAIAYESPKEVGGGIMVAILKDLWGNAIGLIYNPHFT